MKSFRVLATAWSAVILPVVVVLTLKQHPCRAIPFPYEDWELVNNGELLVSALEDLYGDDSEDIGYPSVVRIPSWVTSRANPRAKYYLYYGEHHGLDIRMKWAPTIEGPWTSIRSTTGGVGTVLDFRNDSYRTVQKPGPENWRFVGAPDVFIDNVNQVFVLGFTGSVNGQTLILSNGNTYGFGLSSYVAFSRDGLNFNDPVTGGGQTGSWGPHSFRLPFGPLEQEFLNTNRGDITVTTSLGSPFVRFIQIRGRLFGFHSGGVMSRPQNISSPWHFSSPEAYQSNMKLWIDQTMPDALWRSGDSEIERHKTLLGTSFEYTSHIATWFASSRFLSHPNNPSKTLPDGPYSISSAAGLAKVNHVEVFSIGTNTIEVFIYIRVDTDLEYPVDDPFRDLMRIELDVSSDNWDQWRIARRGGIDVFEVTITPAAVRARVTAANGGSVIDPTKYADPASMGVPSIIQTVFGKYCFIGFKSLARQADFDHSEGQIMAIRLNGNGIPRA